MVKAQQDVFAKYICPTVVYCADVQHGLYYLIHIPADHSMVVHFPIPENNL